MPHHFTPVTPERHAKEYPGGAFSIILPNDFCGNNQAETAMTLAAAEGIYFDFLKNSCDVKKVTIANSAPAIAATGNTTPTGTVTAPPKSSTEAKETSPEETEHRKKLATVYRALLTVAEFSDTAEKRKKAAAEFILLDTLTHAIPAQGPFLPANPCHTARCLYIQIALEKRAFMQDAKNTNAKESGLALIEQLLRLVNREAAEATRATHLPDLIYYTQMAEFITRVDDKTTLLNLLIYLEHSNVVRPLTINELMRCFLEDPILSSEEKIKFLTNSLLDTFYICNKKKSEELRNFFVLLRETPCPGEKGKTWAVVLAAKLPKLFSTAATNLRTNKDVTKQIALTTLAYEIDPQTALADAKAADSSKAADSKSPAPTASLSATASAAAQVIAITADHVAAIINKAAPKAQDKIFSGWFSGSTGSTTADLFLTITLVAEGLTGRASATVIANARLQELYMERTLFVKAAVPIHAPAAPKPAAAPAAVSAPPSSAAAIAVAGGPAVTAGAAVAKTNGVASPTVAPTPAQPAPAPA